MTNLQHSVMVELLKEGMAKGTMPFLTVTSNSMSPLLRQGDEIGLEAVGMSEIRAGDLLVLQEQETFTTHRFWGMLRKKGENMLVTRGDRTLHFDRPWATQQIVGRVVVRRRGQKLLWLNRGRGRRLNHWLARLAQWENRLFSGTEPAPPDLERIPTPAEETRGRKRGLRLPRLLRKIIHGFSWISERVVEYLPARSLQE